MARPFEPDPDHAGEGSALLGRCHLITDPRSGLAQLDVVRAAVEAGIDAVQVRVKGAGDAEVLELVTAVLAVCAPAGAQCIVDDRVDVVMAAGADGVHLGAEDLPVAAARAIAGPRLLIGATARDAESAASAIAAGASYVGVGPAFASSTKPDLPPPIGIAGVAAVCDAVAVPVIAIGGITPARAGALISAGAYGVAVTAAIHRADDPAAAAAELVAAVTRGLAR